MKNILEGHSYKWKINDDHFASGGNSLVYRAHKISENTENQYALKIFNNKPGKRLTRFLLEIDILDKLNGLKGICNLIDHGINDELPFIAMPLYEGGTLARKYFSNQLSISLQDSFRDFINICEIVKTLHEKRPKLAVRDIKPSNILLDNLNNLVLCDFGLSLWSDIDEEDRITESAVGSRGFRAPEWLDKYPEPDQTSGDIWSLGRTFWAMIAKRLPPDIYLSLALPEFHLSNYLSPEYQNKANIIQALINTSLELNPLNRPTINELLSEIRELEKMVFFSPQSDSDFKKKIELFNKDILGSSAIEKSRFIHERSLDKKNEIKATQTFLLQKFRKKIEVINSIFDKRIGGFYVFGRDNSNNPDENILYNDVYAVFFPRHDLKSYQKIRSAQYLISFEYLISEDKFVWKEYIDLDGMKSLIGNAIYPRSILFLATQKERQIEHNIETHLLNTISEMLR